MVMKTTLFAIVVASIIVSAVLSVNAEVYVYFAEQPRLCSLESNSHPGQRFSVFVDSGYLTDVIGVTFRIDTERFGPENVLSISTPAGVSIVSGSLFTGITLSFGARALAHDPVLTVELEDHAPYGDVWTRDIELRREAGTINVNDFGTFGWSFDCSGINPAWDVPDTVVVAAGRDASFSFRAVVSMEGYPPNADVVVVDSEGWVSSPFRHMIFASCGWCPWDWTTVIVPVQVPRGVSNGTLDVVTLQMYSFANPIEERTLVLQAIAPIPVRPSTFGAIKAKYQ
jgi:hypothetical protein